MVLKGEKNLLESLMTDQSHWNPKVEPIGRNNFLGGCMGSSLISIRKFSVFIMCLKTSFPQCLLFKKIKVSMNRYCVILADWTLTYSVYLIL